MNPLRRLPAPLPGALMTMARARHHRTAAALLAATLGLAGCERALHQGAVPTYPDSKLEAMRGITGEPLPHDPHRAGASSLAATASPGTGPASAAAGVAAAPPR